MKEVLRTNDLVLLSYATHILAEAGIEATVFDAHMSAVEGSIGAFPAPSDGRGGRPFESFA